MNNSEAAQKAYDFLNQFKVEISKQVSQLNQCADGALQDGFTVTYLEDGWVTLKGCAWGFVMHYDEPVRMDMTFGPDQPFVGHRITFVANDIGTNISWVCSSTTGETCAGAEQLARFGLRKLAGKCGDGSIFDMSAPALLIPAEPVSEVSARGLEKR